MATEKPRFSVSFSDESFERIQNYKKENSISTQSKAVAQLVELALNDMEKTGIIKNGAPYSPEAMDIAFAYDKKLDRWGKQAVRELVETEVARCEDDSQFLKDTGPAEEPKIIPLYLFPAAAGYAAPVFNEDYEPYELKPEDPQGAVFAVRLQGDSMEPDFPDGSVVFCNRDPLADGDIGGFSVDGSSVCKQYHKEGPVIFLFSLNRARADADVLLLPGGNRTLVCQGRVITRKRYRVPGR